jgi:hypothetical protein
MPLSPGTKLGPYEIVAAIGAGGMGEVYRARDSRLNRQVAIKILPAVFSSDADRLRRFQHEAMAAAALNHPGIIAVYDVGAQDGIPYVVSELLEGETLRDRLRNGALSRRRCLEYGIQIARALAAAHDKAIVHRDLKPENTFITREGRIKILDFGLAKRQEQAAAAAGQPAIPTLTVDTTPGMVLGTVGYMAPEQVRGLPADARSDIFALGALLYEMLSGQRAFKGQTMADSMSAILNEDPPDLAETGREISPAVERIVRHCLEKNPEDRFRSAHDVAFALENISASSQSSVAISTAPRVSHIRALWPLLLSLVIAAVAAGAFLAWRGMRFTAVPTFRRLTFERGMIPSARFADDGRTVIYGAGWESKPVRLFSTSADAPQARALEIDSASLLGVSRSGEMALAVGGKITSHLVIRDAMLARAPLAGGAPREIQEQVRAADWGPDGTLAVVHYVGGRSRVEYPIGKVLYESGGWISHMRLSPAGDRIAFMLHPSWPDDRGFVTIADLAGHEKNLTQEWEGEEGLAWSPKGNEIWFTATSAGADRALYAVTPSGKLRVLLRIPGGLTLHDISHDGRVLLSFDDDRVGMRGARGGGLERDLSWLGWTIVEGISPDGKWVLFSEQGEPTGSNYVLAMRSFDGSPPTRLGEGNGFGFSSDGKWVAATRADRRPQITLLPTGAGQPNKVDVAGLEALGRTSFFPDGKRLLVDGVEHGHAYRTYAVDIAGGKATAITPEGVVSPALSQDCTQLAARDLSGGITIYSLQGKPARIVPGTNSLQPLEWSAGGRFLLATAPDEVPPRILRVDPATGRQELVRKATPSDLGGVYNVFAFRISPDGNTYAYSYRQTLSTLYVAEGLH